MDHNLPIIVTIDISIDMLEGYSAGLSHSAEAFAGFQIQIRSFQNKLSNFRAVSSWNGHGKIRSLCRREESGIGVFFVLDFLVFVLFGVDFLYLCFSSCCVNIVFKMTVFLFAFCRYLLLKLLILFLAPKISKTVFRSKIYGRSERFIFLLFSRQTIYFKNYSTIRV